MVTRAAIDKLGALIEALAAVIDPTAGAIVVAVFARETPEFALQRHCELRSEHRGRRVQYDRRPNERDEMRELAAVWAGATPADFDEFQRAIAKMSVHVAGRSFLGFHAEDDGDANGVNFVEGRCN